MKNNAIEDTLFTGCAACTAVAVAAAFALLLYEVVTLGVSLVQSSALAANGWMRGF